MKPRILDLFCGAGGCSVGYARAGFEVVGVDIEPQPNYPYTFIRADALEFLEFPGRFVWPPGGAFDAIHASPTCQAYSKMSNCRPGLADDYQALIGETRKLLEATGLPYVIENVDGAPLAESLDLFGAEGVVLCGRMFGLELYRHRIFEANFPLVCPPHPPHVVPASKAGHWRPGTIMSVSGHCTPIALAREVMGIDWMDRDELSEAIPPAYCEHIGHYLMAHIESERKEAA